MARKILIVEDNSIDRGILHEILGAQYDILEAEDGAEAISILLEASESLSAIVLDVIMPNMDGYEVLSKIRGNDAWNQIPIIVSTSLDDEKSCERAMSLGAAGFVSKPYSPSLILSTLHNCIHLCEASAMVNSLRNDKLTGILNREGFFEQAEKMIAEQEPGYYMLSCFDIESFRVINDQHGEKIGDEVLRYVAGCIRDCTAQLGGIACRCTADKFAALFPALKRNSDAVMHAHRVITEPPCINHPIKLRIGRYHVVDCSLPVSAMYDRASMAEESIRGQYGTYIAQYEDSMREDILLEQEIVTQMNEALLNGEFETWLQPQFNHSTGALVGAEALVRWRHPEKGIIPPNVFIPIFERNGFIYELDKYVWTHICKYLRRRLDDGLEPLPISVNISRYDVLAEDFIPYLTKLVEKNDVPMDLLRLEVTESAFSDSTGRLIDKINELIALGFTVEIDDFGSGYSSLNTLKDVQAQVIKLDMRFMEKGANSMRVGNIIESVVRMAKWLDMYVIAEGVETKVQADFLNSIGCNLIQGFLYAKAMPMDEFEALASVSRLEGKLGSLETAEAYNNSSFWDASSLDTMIFNHFSGGALIFEYHDGSYETLRINSEFGKTLKTDIPNDELIKMEPISMLDEAASQSLNELVMKAIESDRAESTELHYTKRYTNPGSIEYIKLTIRRIASVGKRHLFYAYADNLTDQRVAEQERSSSAQQLGAIMQSVNGGVTAFRFSGLRRKRQQKH